MTDEPKKIKCLRCQIEKPKKEYQRDSKEYKTCNNCCKGAAILIENCFKDAMRLFDHPYNGIS